MQDMSADIRMDSGRHIFGYELACHCLSPWLLRAVISPREFKYTAKPEPLLKCPLGRGAGRMIGGAICSSQANM